MSLSETLISFVFLVFEHEIGKVFYRRLSKDELGKSWHHLKRGS